MDSQMFPARFFFQTVAAIGCRAHYLMISGALFILGFVEKYGRAAYTYTPYACIHICCLQCIRQAHNQAADGCF